MFRYFYLKARKNVLSENTFSFTCKKKLKSDRTKIRTEYLWIESLFVCCWEGKINLVFQACPVLLPAGQIGPPVL